MPKHNQERTPLLDILTSRAKRDITSFHTPGHKNGQGIDPKLRAFTGRNVYKLDVTVFPEVDSLHDPVGPIKKAQQLMAQAYGVKYSQFLVNGSSSGNMAMLMSLTPLNMAHQGMSLPAISLTVALHVVGM